MTDYWVSGRSTWSGDRYGRTRWAEYAASVFDVPVDMLLSGVERVVRKANLHSRPAYTTAALAPMHPKDWAHLQTVYPFVASPQERQPWLWTYPPLVVDREKLAWQIRHLLDPMTAAREWFESEFGRGTGVYCPNYRDTVDLRKALDEANALERQRIRDALS